MGRVSGSGRREKREIDVKENVSYSGRGATSVVAVSDRVGEEWLEDERGEEEDRLEER